MNNSSQFSNRCVGFTVGLALISLVAKVGACADQTVRPPNVVFVLADDLGWGELGCYGNGFNEAPNLDKLAQQGMRFTQAYAAAPVCSPYRAAFLTGQHPARIGILDYLRPNSANALSTDQITLAEMFQKRGYETGMVGKWHLTGYEHHQAEYEVKPRQHGFDWDFAREVKGVGNGANFWPYVFRDQPIRWIDIPKNRLGKDEYLTDRMNVEAVDFIERNKERPFFLYLSHYAPHTILNGRPDLVEKYRKKHTPGKSGRTRCHLCQDHGHKGDALNHWAEDHNPHLAAMLESVDDGIGQITRKLDELSLTENTIFIFTSDNGGETKVTSNAPLRGGKSQLYEGGVRVPMIVRWPQHVPADSVCKHPTMNVDFYPTLLEAAGIQTPKEQTLDGVSTLATWKKPETSIDRDALYWHYPLDRPHFLGGVSGGAIRDGNWKLIEFFDTNKTELYSFVDDPSEQRNVANDHPKVAQQLQQKLAKWRRSVNAQQPSPPLLTEPRQLYFADHFSSNRASERWWFNKNWSAENGKLVRGTGGTDATRIFLRDTKFRDAVIRFDFQLQSSKDVRLVTGSGGHYNSVIHIRPDHFYIQTAKDESAPYFSYRHGECAFEFDPKRWYTMTVEFIGNQLVAHIDREHVAYAQHPIINRERQYFAFQVDDQPAAFDNVQILTAKAHREPTASLKYVRGIIDLHPVQKPLTDVFNIRKTNAHEWLYQRHEKYRMLVTRIDELDEQKARQFPIAFQSHKVAMKKVQELRKKHLNEDPRYKERLFATHRANREIEAWLFAQQAGAADLPDSRRRRELAQLHKRHQNAAAYKQLIEASESAQQLLENTYPQLYVSDEQIKETRNKRRQELKTDATYQKLNNDRAAAHRAQQAYLFANDKILTELQTLMDAQKQKND